MDPMTDMQALSMVLQVTTVFAVPFLIPTAIKAVNARTNLFKRRYRLLNTRHMVNPERYLAQFEVSADGKFGTKRPIGAKARRYG